MPELTKEAMELLIHTGEAHNPGYLCDDDNTEILVLRTAGGGQTYVNLEDQKDARRERPRRIKTTNTFLEPKSFLEYWKNFADQQQSAIFGTFTPEAISFQAVLDYHRHGSEGAPGWCQHVANLKLGATIEWVDWQNKNGRDKAMTPEQFAGFIELHDSDFTEPPVDKMIAIAENLHVDQNVTYSAKGRARDGRTMFTATETTKEGVSNETSIEVPAKFTIELEAYFGCGSVKVTAYLRYALNAGKLIFWYELIRPQRVRKVVFDAVRADIEKETSGTVLMGSCSNVS